MHAADMHALRDALDAHALSMQRRLGDLSDVVSTEKQARREAIASVTAATQASVRDMKHTVCCRDDLCVQFEFTFLVSI